VTAARQQVTREWWEESLNQFDTYISALVLEEASGGGAIAAASRLKAIEGMPVLEITDEAEELAAALVKVGLIPVTLRMLCILL